MELTWKSPVTPHCARRSDSYCYRAVAKSTSVMDPMWNSTNLLEEMSSIGEITTSIYGGNQPDYFYDYFTGMNSYLIQ